MSRVGWLAIASLAACAPLQVEPIICDGEVVDFETDEDHCGACGVRCSDVRGVARGACVAQVCTILECAGDDERQRVDVDGDATNGCEVERDRCDGELVDLLGNATHCGACDFDCAVAPAWAAFAMGVACERGICQASACRGRNVTVQRITVDGEPFDQAICEPPPPTCLDPETCNGIDDDCDGHIDECPALPGTRPRTCRPGPDGDDGVCPPPVCADGFVAVDGDPTDGCECEILGEPGEELCNGADDDCDGAIDEDLGEQACGVGHCRRTAPLCVDGEIGPCTPGEPIDELCNGVDDDCDGTIDEGFPVGDDCVVGRGQCATEGTWVCGAGGERVTCDAEAGTPVTERCNGVDDDCDGAIDEDFEPGAPCAVGVGACRAWGQRICTEDGAGSTCGAVPGRPTPEACNGIDDDCDELIDEALPDQTCGVGACQRTLPLCHDGELAPCLPGEAAVETCNGVDDDCDGGVDEDFDIGAVCVVGTGECRRAATLVCDADGLSSVCNTAPGLPPSPNEIRCDGADDDCDGAIDENFELGTACWLGVGACAREGERICGADLLSSTCDAVPGEPVDEACNGIDDDCDEAIDEALPDQTCGVGACERTVPLCVRGALAPCTPGEPFGLVEARCDGVDDDCDGTTDEDFDIGAPCAVGVGACRRKATRVCAPDGTGAVCDTVPGEPVGPEEARCDGLDDDCDGATDEGFDLGAICRVGIGQCERGGVRICDPDRETSVCDAVPRQPTDELCNNLDDDCDGEFDEGFDLGAICVEGIGACITAGVLVCRDDTRASICDARVPVGEPESCNGIDDDCDGPIDEQLQDCFWPCGNGEVDDGEACDDGGNAAGDGCSVQCQWELPDTTRLLGSPGQYAGDVVAGDAAVYEIELDAAKRFEIEVWHRTGGCEPDAEPQLFRETGPDEGVGIELATASAGAHGCPTLTADVPPGRYRIRIGAGDERGIRDFVLSVWARTVRSDGEPCDARDRDTICDGDLMCIRGPGDEPQCGTPTLRMAADVPPTSVQPGDRVTGVVGTDSSAVFVLETDEPIAVVVRTAAADGGCAPDFRLRLLALDPPDEPHVARRGPLEDADRCPRLTAELPPGAHVFDLALDAEIPVDYVVSFYAPRGEDEACDPRRVLDACGEGLACADPRSEGIGRCVPCPIDPPSGFTCVPPGIFDMGAPLAEANGPEEAQHKVSLTRGIFVGGVEVDREQWETIAGYDRGPSPCGPGEIQDCVSRGSQHRPAAAIRWHEAVAYCNERSIREGLPPCYRRASDVDGEPYGFADANEASPARDPVWIGAPDDGTPRCTGWRLPTEAEWEYLARSGSPEYIRYPWGTDDPTCLHTNFNRICHRSAHISCGASEGITPLGLCDVSGNVWEWTWDVAGTYDFVDPEVPVLDPYEPAPGTEYFNFRIVRGGSFANGLSQQRTAYRSGLAPDQPSVDAVGVRIVRSLPVLE